VRALVEGQVLAKRIHAQNMGFKICKHVSIKEKKTVESNVADP
jgi:hypothetical protein